MIVWHKFETEKPPVGVEVIAYHSKWINPDFNPIGQRVEFLNDEGEEFDHDSDNIKYIDPEYWTEMPKFSDATCGGL